MTTTISVATTRDARAIADLRTAVANGMTQQFGLGHWSARTSKAAVVRQMRASHMWVARREGEVIGTVRLATAQPSAIDARSFTPVKTALYVLGLTVAPAARGQGVGRQLVEVAKGAARDWHADALWLDAYDHAAGAGSFYQCCGFREVGPSAYKEVSLTYYEWLVT